MENKRTKSEKTKRPSDKTTKRPDIEFNIAMSVQFRALAMFYFVFLKYMQIVSQLQKEEFNIKFHHWKLLISINELDKSRSRWGGSCGSRSHQARRLRKSLFICWENLFFFCFYLLRKCLFNFFAFICWENISLIFCFYLLRKYLFNCLLLFAEKIAVCHFRFNFSNLSPLLKENTFEKIWY